LEFGPVTLPRATREQAYRINLHDVAQPGWHGMQYEAGALPPGLKLVSGPQPLLAGIPTTAGAFHFVVYAVHGVDANGCSTMPDPHDFRLEGVDADAGTDASLE